MNSDEKITKLSDIADELGLSVSTVSRALSGNGRVGKATRDRVQSFLETHKYQPNMLAKGLADGQTYNICVLLPSETLDNQIPFFYECLMGICSVGIRNHYSTIITSDKQGSTEHLQAALSANKADGYIVLRATDDDPALKLIHDSAYPLVVTGKLNDSTIDQVDEDNFGICREFTKEKLKSGCKKLLLILGDMAYNVNRARKEGFEAALLEQGLKGQETIYTNIVTKEQLAEVAKEIEKQDFDSVFCGDDLLCARFMNMTNKIDNIRIYSFYHSEILSATKAEAPHFNANALGKRAAELLIKKIKKKN